MSFLRSKFALLGLIALICLGLFGLRTQRFARFEPAAEAQTCTPPLFQGFTSSCTVIPLRWLNRDPVTAIDHYEVWRGGVKVGDAPASSLGFSDPVGCSFAASYTIVQINKNGARCQTVTTGNIPHSRPCDQCGGGGGGQTSGFKAVNAASFTEPASGAAIAALFPSAGTQFGTQTMAAGSIPLPTELAGVRVTLDGVPAGLFYVSPGQINLLMPDVNAGQFQVNITLPSGQSISGPVQLSLNPGIFSARSDGTGPPAAVVTTNGINFLPVSSGGLPIPINTSTASQPNYLILFGTGLRGTVEVRIGGELCPVTFAGRSPSLLGVDQVNVRLPESLANRGSVSVLVIANGFGTNTTTLNIR